MRLRRSSRLSKRFTFLAFALLPIGAPAQADGGYTLRHIGDWALAQSTAPKKPALLVNTIPRNPLARAGCAGNVLELPVKDLGFPDGYPRVLAILNGTGYACLVISCFRTPQGILSALYLSTARHTGPTETPPGRVTLHLQLLPGGPERTLFKDATWKDKSLDGQLKLVALSFQASMAKENPYRMIVAFNVPWRFFAPLARRARARLRVPSGRGASGDPSLDVPHAPRDMVFGLSRTAAAFAQFAKACPLAAGK